MRRTLTRLAALSALTFTSAHAASGCTALYATVNYGSAVALDFVNTVTKTSSPVFDQTAANSAITNINGAALNPVNGRVYYIDRTTTTKNDLYVFDPVTRTTQFLRAVTLPSGAVNIGGTFDGSGSAPRYYLLYNNYTIQELDPATGALIRTLTVNYPATDALGKSAARANATSGDLVFANSTAYAALDGTSGGSGVVYWINLGTLGTVTGTTVTPTSANLRPIVDSAGTAIAANTVNGAAITPFSETYISYASTLALLNTGGTGTVTTSSPTTNGTRQYTDLSDCTVLPDTPTVTKAFNPAVIRTGQTSTLTLTLTSTNPSPAYTMSALTDPLPAGVVIAATPNLSTTCLGSGGAAATVTAAAGSGSVTLASGTRVPQSGATCTVTVTVTGQTRGSKLNTIAAGGLVTTAGTSTAASTATLLVNDPVTGTNSKQQRLYPSGTLGTGTITAKPKDLLEYCVTSTHAGVGFADATTATIRDVLNTNLTFESNGYGAGQDVKLTRAGSTTYLTFAADGDRATVDTATRTLTVNILPFDSANASVTACFIARVN